MAAFQQRVNEREVMQTHTSIEIAQMDGIRSESSHFAGLPGNRSATTIQLLLLWALFLTVVLLTPSSAQAQTNYYVRAGATGAMNGSDWDNAFQSLPTNLVRGATYYIAVGNYGSHKFSDPVSGTALITIKKATPSNHGTDTGWQDTYGDGPAVFSTATFTFASSYYVLDGSTGGGPGSWTTGHGFKFTSPAGTSLNYVSIVDGVSNIIARHCYFEQVGDVTAYTAMTCAFYAPGSASNLLIEYCYMQNLGGLPFMMRNGSGNIFQYNYTGYICGTSRHDGSQHCEALVEHGMNDVHFRWNYIADSPSSGGFVKNNTNVSDLIRIYGNVFVTGSPIACNTGTCSNWIIANNSFVNFKYGPAAGDGQKVGCFSYNNISYKSLDYGVLFPATRDYNWFSSVMSPYTSNANVNENVILIGADKVTETSDPFVRSSGNAPEDFRLTGPLTNWPGYDVCQLDPCIGENKYNMDMFGVMRGADGVWDRGAIELQAGKPSTPSGFHIE